MNTRNLDFRNLGIPWSVNINCCLAYNDSVLLEAFCILFSFLFPAVFIDYSHWLLGDNRKMRHSFFDLSMLSICSWVSPICWCITSLVPCLHRSLCGEIARAGWATCTASWSLLKRFLFLFAGSWIGRAKFFYRRYTLCTKKYDNFFLWAFKCRFRSSTCSKSYWPFNIHVN